MLHDVVSDLRYAWRLLVHAPGFATVAVLSIAIGLGASTAIFSLVDAVLLRALPVEGPAELVFFQTTGPRGHGGSPPFPWFERVRRQAPAFAGMAAFASDEMRVDVGGQVEQVFGQVASGSLFGVLGVRPWRGRLLTPADERLSPAVAVIGHDYWQRRFGGSPEVIGRTLTQDDRLYTIVGVTPPAFEGLEPGRRIDVTVPISPDTAPVADTKARWFTAVARLRPDASVAEGTAQADTIFQAFRRDHPPGGHVVSPSEHVQLVPAGQGLDRLRQRFATPLRALMLVALAVLLIACGNLGNLLLVRGETRGREMAVRLATGASTGRLVRQLLTETLVLFVLGAAGGLLLAWLGVRALVDVFAIGRNPIALSASIDWRAAGFAAAVSLIAALVTGLWPARRALRVDPQAALKRGEARIAGDRRFQVVSRGLLVGQVALSLVLVVSALLFAITMRNLHHVDLGFSGRHVLTMSLDPALRGADAPAGRRQFWARVLERVRALPGVRAAGVSVLTPLSGRDTGTVLRGSLASACEADRSVRLNHVSEGYLEAFGIAVRAGRALAPADATSRVALINETTARSCFAGRTAVGEALDVGNGAAYRIVGVVADATHRSLREETVRMVYVPVWQPVDRLSRVTLSIASDQPGASLVRVVTQEIHALHPDTLVSDVVGVDEQIDATLVSERVVARLGATFAAVALALAAIGLYGLLSYAVARRRAEFAVRMVLGAGPSRVRWELWRDVQRQLAAGIALGLPAAWTVAHVLGGLLFGVEPRDPLAYVLATAVLVAVAALAAARPMYAASSLSPSEALRRG